MNKLEDLIKVITPLGTLFILFGLLEANFYYAAFHIDIFPYIEFGEAIMLFLSQIVPLLTIFLIIGLLFFIYNDGGPGNFIKPGKTLAIVAFITPIFFILTDLFATKKMSGYKYLDLTWNTYWFPAFKLMYLFAGFKLISLKKWKGVFIMNAIGIFIFGLIFTSQLKVVKTITRANNQITITLKDSVIIQSDSANLFLGRTKNYFIFFNTEKNQASFISNDLVSRVDLKN